MFTPPSLSFKINHSLKHLPICISLFPSRHRYVIIKKLGWGHFSTVWMVKDRKLSSTATKSPGVRSSTSNQPVFFALKVQKSAEHYTEAAMDEVELLDCIAQERKKCEGTLVAQGPMARDTVGVRAIDNVDHSRHVATLHDSFFHNGPNGRHMSMVFGMLGCNLLSVIKAFNYRGIPIPAVKRMIKGICKGLDFLHRRCHIIHTDLKPENILLQFPDQICPPSLLEEDGEYDDDDDDNGNEHAMIDNDDDDDDTVGTGGQIMLSQQEGMSIEELELALKNPKISSDERKRLKKRLKRKRQKERRKQANASNLGQADDVEDDEDYDFDAQSTLSDGEIESYFKNSAENSLSSSDKGAFQNVRSKADDNKFVSRNFAPTNAGESIAGIMNDTVVLTAAGLAEVEANLGACGSLMRRQHRVDGVAEVSFLMRVLGTESDLAELVSNALDGIGWGAKEPGSGTKVW
jgi:hypothetical protein